MPERCHANPLTRCHPLYARPRPSPPALPMATGTATNQRSILSRPLAETGAAPAARPGRPRLPPRAPPPARPAHRRSRAAPVRQSPPAPPTLPHFLHAQRRDHEKAHVLVTFSGGSRRFTLHPVRVCSYIAPRCPHPPPWTDPTRRARCAARPNRFAGGNRTQARGRNSNNDDAPFEDETEELMRNDIDAPVDDEEEDGEELIGDAMEE